MTQNVPEAGSMGAPPRRSAAVTALLSLLLLGLGHLHVGRWRRGVGWFLVGWAVDIGALALLAYFPIAQINMGFALALWLGWRCVVAADAVYVSRLRHAHRGVAPSVLHYPVFAFLAWCSNAIFATLIGTFWLHAYTVPTSAMAPSIEPGDHVLADHAWYRWHDLERGDVVVRWRDGPGSTMFVQRIIGLPGETVALRDGMLSVNGTPMREPYADWSGDPPPHQDTENFGPTTIEPDHVFLLGDNRHRSYDSRFVGNVPVRDIVGRVMVIYWSSTPPPPPVRSATRRQRPPTRRWSRLGTRFDRRPEPHDDPRIDQNAPSDAPAQSNESVSH